MNTSRGKWCASDWWIAGALFALALLLRLIYLKELSSGPLFDNLFGDARGFEHWAQRIAAGNLFAVETTDPGISMESAPLYPYFLGLVQALFGRSFWAMRGMQMVISAGSCVLLFGATGPPYESTLRSANHRA